MSELLAALPAASGSDGLKARIAIVDVPEAGDPQQHQQQLISSSASSAEDNSEAAGAGAQQKTAATDAENFAQAADAATLSGSSKQRTNSLGKLFQKMRGSEVLARLRREDDTVDGDGGGVDQQLRSTKSAKGGAGSSAPKTGSLRKYMGSTWYTCWQKSAANATADDAADYNAYSGGADADAADKDSSSIAEVPHSDALATPSAPASTSTSTANSN